MSHTRRQDQSVDAFSLPTELLAKAKQRAAQLQMTKSGFYRFCLAKELGYSETEARAFAQHRAVLNSVERAISSSKNRSAGSRAADSVRKNHIHGHVPQGE